MFYRKPSSDLNPISSDSDKFSPAVSLEPLVVGLSTGETKNPGALELMWLKQSRRDRHANEEFSCNALSPKPHGAVGLMVHDPLSL